MTEEQIAQHLEGVDAALMALLSGKEVREVLAQAGEWQFDVFELTRVTKGKPLQVLGMHLIRHYGSIEKLGLDRHRLTNFLVEIERGMPFTNPYHNAIHCADVLQSMHVIISRGGMGDLMSDVEILAALVGAIIHDFEHMGVNNDLLVKMGHAWAIEYNDTAPNENHHLAAAFKLLMRPECNFIQQVAKADQQLLRKLVLDMVIATDMSAHQEIVDKINKTLQPTLAAARGGAAPPQPLDPRAKSLMLCGAIKVCDIGHAFADTNQHAEWSERLEEELYKQGDLERSVGLPMSHLMDRSKPGATQSQLGFFDIVVRPLTAAWAACFPNCRALVELLEVNYLHWQGASALLK